MNSGFETSCCLSDADIDAARLKMDIISDSWRLLVNNVVWLNGISAFCQGALAGVLTRMFCQGFVKDVLLRINSSIECLLRQDAL